MGRPVRYGGEMGGVRERTAYMAEIAGESLAPEVIEDSAKFRRVLAREPVGIVLRHRALELSVPDRDQHHRPGADRRQRGGAEAREPDAARRRAAGAGLRAPAGRALHQRLPRPCDHVGADRRAAPSTSSTSPAASAAGRRSSARRPAPSSALGLELGGKDPGYVRADADLDAAVETLMDGAMYNSGQCCCGIERIYVAEPLYDAFVEKSAVAGLRLPARQPARAGDDARADGEPSASPTPCAARSPRRWRPGRRR